MPPPTHWGPTHQPPQLLRVSPLAYRVHQVLQRQALIPPGARVVVGVSGGPDSVALLSLLAELRGRDRLTVWGVYVNHGWRPPAARREAAMVRRVGRQLCVPIRVVTISRRKAPRRSWEGTARQRRYAALGGIARRVGASIVAVGHTQEDQAETMLLALARGSGLRGLGGMPASRPLASRGAVRLARPLLGFRHAVLRTYLRQRRLPWMEDATNRAMRFRRNALRRMVLAPLVRWCGPQVVDRMATCAELLREDEAYLTMQVARWMRRHLRRRGGVCQVPLAAVRRQPLALRRRLVREVVAWADGGFGERTPHHRLLASGRAGLTARQTDALVALVGRREAVMDLPRGLRARVAGGAFLVRRRPRSPAPGGVRPAPLVPTQRVGGAAARDIARLRPLAPPRR